MSHCEFDWCDLSTFDLRRATLFYRTVFEWTNSSGMNLARDDDYTFCLSKGHTAAAMYTMPKFFQQISMPSFWMSYIRVSSIDRCVDESVRLGGKCEIEPMRFDAQSRIALVRDPSGAGFTLYEGPSLNGRGSPNQSGRMVWNELQLESLASVSEFYQGVFNWTIAPDDEADNRYLVLDDRENPLASMQEIETAIKGPKNYWAVFFSVSDLRSTITRITELGGRVIMNATAEANYAMVVDDQNAMFFVKPIGP